MAPGYADQTQSYEWLNELERPEVQESLKKLIQKLPEIQRSMDSVGNLIQFSESVVKDRETIDKLEQRLTYSSINAESIEALVQLLGKLPVLLKLVERLEQVTVFLESVWKDKETLDQLYHSAMDFPVVERGKETLELVDRIKEKAESQPQQQISIFTVLKWMKDPNVQKGLHYIQATLDTISEKSR
ncbi:uncharacterized protein YjgD (DUF1641 family) [Bacillus pakistanensis]|uniref:Uncharacterized protein YjgD (DUF1641 family) n=1 Tax=Rossellomorea pakistanensis TaxID=992288 RepID=A0ABS2NDL0_9BACI|nr:hypothetical protein [Bacillus pakistanensis]MBM7585943.1 uncharacterized protein YjgD (DUF1641 family) [Bacillus pakistanensis]